MAEGLRHVRADKVLLLLLVLSFVSVAFGMPLNTLLPVFTEDENLLNVGPQGLGLLLSMTGVGALIGSVAIASMGDFKRKGIVLLVLTFLWGGSIVLFTTTRLFPLALLLMVPIGIGQAGRNVLVSTLMLTRAPEEARGRVISLSMMTWGLQPLGLLPIGAASEAIGAPMAVAIGGAIVAVMGLGMLLVSPRLRRLE
jgi:MFS family permease